VKCDIISKDSQTHIITAMPCMKYTYYYLDDNGNMNDKIYITEESFFNINDCEYNFPNRYIFNSDSYIHTDSEQKLPDTNMTTSNL